jgi:hypothetical protein
MFCVHTRLARPSPACSATLDAWCGDRKNPVMKACYASQHNQSVQLLAAYATADGGTKRAWRCYAVWDLNGPNPAAVPIMQRARNVSKNPGDYCSSSGKQILGLLLKCDPGWTPPPPPPPPPCPHPCPLDPPPINRSCAATVQWHPGVQLHVCEPVYAVAFACFFSFSPLLCVLCQL